MTQLLRNTLAAALSATVVLASGPAFAYGAAAPMSVSGIDAQAPVTSLQATTTATTPAESAEHAPAVRPASTLRRWIAELRRRLDGAIEVALR